jgi:hypothetical protein
MKYALFILALAFSPIVQAEDDPPKRGEVTQIVVLKSWQKPNGKTTVMVWNGSKSVRVILPTQYLRKVLKGRIFPYEITVDPKTGQYVSNGRRGL